jgi:RHS repeat-associated protein
VHLIISFSFSVFATPGSPTLTRYYLGNYEEEHADGKVRKLHYISGGNPEMSGQAGLAAIMVKNGDIDSLYYTYTDYQGNLLAVTDATGTVKERYAYDPWGLRRNPTDWTQRDTRSKLLFARGYTMHEHLDQFGLINMNGRVYDPLVAQFLSTDPYIQDGGNWQNYNRYAYCWNNPLMFTDPSGEFIHLIIGGAIGGITNWIASGAKFDKKGCYAFNIGTLAGALGAGVGSGISSALPAAAGASGAVGASGGFAAGFWGTSAATTAASGFVSGALIGGGAGFSSGFITGAGNAWAGGASFGDGLWSGAESGLIGGVSGAVIGGVLGGLDAVGDKRNFWSGDDQGSDRSLFAFNNTDKPHTHYLRKGGTELIDNIEREGSPWISAYDERVDWGTSDVPLSNGAIARRDNYLLIDNRDGLNTFDRSLGNFHGRANMNLSGVVPEGCRVEISFDGKVVQTFNAGYGSGALSIPANVQNLRVSYIGKYFGTVSPWRTTITGCVRY